jgi:hypothetical protein
MITHLMRGAQLVCCGMDLADCPEGDGLTSLPERMTCTGPPGRLMARRAVIRVTRRELVHTEVPPMPRRWRA